MSKSLTPEKRPDKNGNIVTRWIKSFSRGKTVREMPAPTLSHKPERLSFDESAALRQKERDEQDRRRAEVNTKVALTKEVLFPPKTLHYGNAEDYEYDSHSRDRTRENLEYLIRHAPDLLQRVLDTVQSKDEARPLFGHIIRHSQIAPGRGHSYYDYEGSASPKEPTEAQIQSRLMIIREALVVHTLVSRLSESGFLSGSDLTEDGQRAIVNDLRSATETVLARKHLVSFNDDDIEAVATMMYVTGAHEDRMFAVNQMSNTIYDDNSEDIAYLVSRITEVRDIIPLLAERKSCDRELVASLLDFPSSALVEGVL